VRGILLARLLFVFGFLGTILSGVLERIAHGRALEFSSGFALSLSIGRFVADAADQPTLMGRSFRTKVGLAGTGGRITSKREPSPSTDETRNSP
jgi:hypothetical protein